MTSDQQVVLHVVRGMIAIAVVGLVGLLLLIAYRATIPTELMLIVSNAVTCLGTLLTSTRGRSEPRNEEPPKEPES